MYDLINKAKKWITVILLLFIIKSNIILFEVFLAFFFNILLLIFIFSFFINWGLL